MSEAREQILRSVRESLADIPDGEQPESVHVARDYHLSDSSDRSDLIDQFIERVTDYRALVRRVSEQDLPSAIRDACGARNVRRVAIPADLPNQWLTEELEWLRDPGLSYPQLDQAEGVLTACALAIAQTGTIILDGGPAQGRRALTLLPDYHVCVVRDDQIVGLVPEAISRLERDAHAPGRPLTWISGPSATSDIELSRVEGVHGPRTLEVLLVSSGG